MGVPTLLHVHIFQSNKVLNLEVVCEILLQHDIKLIVASGAEEKELRKILKEHDLEKYFSYIGGSPNSKEEIVKKFIDHNASLKIKGLVFGDSISDLRVAENFDFDFIFIEEESEWSNHLDYINKFVFQNHTLH